MSSRGIAGSNREVTSDFEKELVPLSTVLGREPARNSTSSPASRSYSAMNGSSQLQKGSIFEVEDSESVVSFLRGSVVQWKIPEIRPSVPMSGTSSFGGKSEGSEATIGPARNVRPTSIRPSTAKARGQLHEHRTGTHKMKTSNNNDDKGGHGTAPKFSLGAHNRKLMGLRGVNRKSVADGSRRKISIKGAKATAHHNQELLSKFMGALHEHMRFSIATANSSDSMDLKNDISTSPSGLRLSIFARGGVNKNSNRMTRLEEEKYMQSLRSPYRQALYLEKHSHFDMDEIRALWALFKSCAPKSGEWNRAIFREIMINCLGIYNDSMLDRMFSYFDSDREGTITGTEFVQNLSVILRGTLDQQINYCYHVYNSNGERGITRETLFGILRGSWVTAPGDEDTEDSIRELVELTMRKLDMDRTGLITPENFRAAVRRDPLLLQCLGPCLPRESYLRLFSYLFADQPERFTTNYSLHSDPGYNIKPKVKSANWRHGSLTLLFHR